MGVDVTDLGASLATLVVAVAAFIESYRGRRKAAAGVRAVAPDDGPSLTTRLDGIERELHDVRGDLRQVKAEQADTRRAVGRVETDMATHLQVHTVLGMIRQRWSRESSTPPRGVTAGELDGGDSPGSGGDGRG